jgi:hypothetical protein
VGEDLVTTFRAAWPQCEGIWRPPEFGSALAPVADISISAAVMPSWSISARSR